MTTQRTASSGLGSLGSGAVTAAALAIQQGLAAAVGILIAREFGRGSETDGFFASYGVFVAITIAATAGRVVFLPSLARARAARRLGGETAAYAVALAAFAVPLLVIAIVGANAVASLLTGFDEGEARSAAAATLPWLTAAGLGQLYAGLAASALAALDDYRTAAAGYALGSVVGLAFIVWRVQDDGIEAVAWGMALSAGIAVAVPAATLALRARRERMPRAGARPAPAAKGRRLGELAAGASLPLALQVIYVVCLPFAAAEGVGTTTSLGYAYLAGSAVVTVTASALALVTAVPLTRAGLEAAGVARQVGSSAWLALVVVGATTGIVAAAGEPLADAVLGGAYGSNVGEELARLLVTFSLWMLVTIGLTVTFPLVFVAGRGARLPPVALLVVTVHVPLAWLGAVVAGVYGLALALAVSTAVALVAMLRLLDAVALTIRALAMATGVLAAVVVVSFAPARLLLEPVPAAVAGLGLYVAILLGLRPAGLRSAWRYFRALA